MKEVIMKNEIQLTPSQAKNWIKQYYPNHFNFLIALSERVSTNLQFNQTGVHKEQSDILFQILTAPKNSEFLVRKEYVPVEQENQEVLQTTITPMGMSLMLKGTKNESAEHLELAFIFLKAKTFSWFRHKKPLAK